MNPFFGFTRLGVVYLVTLVNIFQVIMQEVKTSLFNVPDLKISVSINLYSRAVGLYPI